MLARDPKLIKKRRLTAARVKRNRERKKRGVINLRADLDQVAVEALLEEVGLLKPGVEHSHKEIEEAWNRYVPIVVASEM